MVSPHFPPDSSAASHRVRLLAPYLAESGWSPTVVTVDKSAYEGRLDADLEALVPPSLRVVHARAWPAPVTRLFGVGDLGLRAFSGLRRACEALLAREHFDALFITVYPVYPALLGPVLKRRFGVRFVLDYQDPWVGAWGRTVGGGANGRPDWKSRMSRRLGLWLEPKAVSAADAIVAVSQGTIDGVVERIPEAARLPHQAIPLGFEPADFERLGRQPRSHSFFDVYDRRVHLCYVGTLLPTGVAVLATFLGALRRLCDKAPNIADRIRVHFFGTSNQSRGDRERVIPVAQQYGVAHLVTEHPGRLDYLDALSVLTSASAIVLLGSTEPHYTASKLYPALLARRPVVALFHEASSVVEILRQIGHEPTIRLVTYRSDRLGEEQVASVACHLAVLARDPRYDPHDVDLAGAADVSARSLARQLAGVFDRICAA
jgi:glycosyltransferase involved in cell wall biosynthesis